MAPLVHMRDPVRAGFSNFSGFSVISGFSFVLCAQTPPFGSDQTSIVIKHVKTHACVPSVTRAASKRTEDRHTAAAGVQGTKGIDSRPHGLRAGIVAVV